VRTEMNVPAGAKIPLVVAGADKALRARAQAHEETIKRLARLDAMSFAKAPPKGAALLVVGETTLALPLEGVIDMGAERRRLAKEIAEAEGDAAKMDAKLANPQFVARAKPEAVEETRERKSDLEARARRLKAALARIEA
jgi:valyl-tRNA synthetase